MQEEREKLHQVENPRESLRTANEPIARDIAKQLDMLEQYTPVVWQSYFKSFSISAGLNIELVTRRLIRNADNERLEQLYDILMDATQKPANLNDNELSKHAEETVAQ